MAEARRSLDAVAVSYFDGPHLSARARGFDARCRGLSMFGCPYDSFGPAAGYANAWWEGWHAADAIVGPSPRLTVDLPEEE